MIKEARSYSPGFFTFGGNATSSRSPFTTENFMANATERQRQTEGRVMHEFKHGELKSGADGKAGKVKSRKQAIAIALSEAGDSKFKSASENRKTRKKAAKKEARGKTAQQEKEGKSNVGARDKRESTRAMGGKNATQKTKPRRSAK